MLAQDRRFVVAYQRQLGGTSLQLLSQLNNRNAKDLKVAWIMSVGAKTDAQATPLYHDGVIYFPQDNKVFAIDAENGQVCGSTSTSCRTTGAATTSSFFTGKHRGVASCGDNVYFLSNDNKLHSIDMKTGKAKWVKD